MSAQALTIRTATPEDRQGILALAVRALGWAGDERDNAFLTWKHDANPFGASPAWVATDRDQIVGFRTFMRWELHRGSERLRLVRAVDTATDPDYQGQGIFRRLTLTAVEELTAQGFDAVFNTPNDQSRPGYLKMGWSELGRPRLWIRPSRLRALPRLLQSRRPAAKWSDAPPIGQPVTESHVDAANVPAPDSDDVGAWSTPRTASYLAWRYGFEALHYRSLRSGDSYSIFRVRQRGPSCEVALCEYLGPRPYGHPKGLRRAGDYLVALGSHRPAGMVPLPRLGPIVTWRPLALREVPTISELDLGLGDLELF